MVTILFELKNWAMTEILTATAEGVPANANDLPAVPGGWATKSVTIANRTIRLTSPRDPDSFLDDPDVTSAHAQSGYMPYWGYIWPAAWDMSGAVLEEKWPTDNGPLEVLEIGSGVGLVGLAALASGLSVTFSDYDPQAVASSLFNARQNGWNNARGIVLDWRKPLDQKYPLIFGGDVIYERVNHEPILNLLDAMLSDDGTCWLADPTRVRTEAFVMLACRRGYRVEHRPLPEYPLPNRQQQPTDLWILTKSKCRTEKAEG